MSPRAASRLETLGYGPVYDYIAGKADWGAAGLPLDGENDSTTRAAAHARTDVPTCRLDESLQAVRRRVSDTGWEICFVVNADGVVLGLLGRHALGRDDNLTITAVMTEAPSTVRPSARLDELVERMRRQIRASRVCQSPRRMAGSWDSCRAKPPKRRSNGRSQHPQR